MTATRTALFLLLLVALNMPGRPVAADALMVPDRAALQPAWLLEVPDTSGDVLIADTHSATMYRFRKTATGLVEVDRRYMSIGENGAGKKRAWDRKTPLGVYFITDRLDATRLADQYGVAAFPLDYPNTWDRINGRTGYGIWLHGVDRKNPQRPPLDTDGCLALPNDELMKLVDTLAPLETPVIVTRGMRWSAPQDLSGLRAELRDAVESWRRSLESGDLLGYLSHYAAEFRYRDMELADWSSWRMAVFDRRPLTGVKLGDMLLVADPEEPGLYLSRFTQVLTSAGNSITTRKRLYWRHDEAGDWKIVAEDSG
jgi:murein L,D-transpeptidase YafK